MAEIVCPKCGLEQDQGTECRGCRIVFDRYRAAPETPPSSVPAPIPSPAGPSAVWRYYRVVRWVVLAGIVVLVVLVLSDAPLPQVESVSDSGRGIQLKMLDLQTAFLTGGSARLHLDEAELNFWLWENLDFEESPSAVQDLRVQLNGDVLSLYLVFLSYGQDLSLTLEGRVQVTDGYLQLEPSGGKLGSLPIPLFGLERAVRRLFESPENRETFRMPTEIRDIRVEDSELVISFSR